MVLTAEERDNRKAIAFQAFEEAGITPRCLSAVFYIVEKLRSYRQGVASTEIVDGEPHLLVRVPRENYEVSSDPARIDPGAWTFSFEAENGGRPLCKDGPDGEGNIVIKFPLRRLAEAY